MNDIDKSILLSVKKMIGYEPDYDVFDIDIMFHINSLLSKLLQLGYIFKSSYRVSSKEKTWDEILNGSEVDDMIKDYIYMKCKIVFDPPQNSTVLGALKDEASELEWRIFMDSDIESGDKDE